MATTVHGRRNSMAQSCRKEYQYNVQVRHSTRAERTIIHPVRETPKRTNLEVINRAKITFAASHGTARATTYPSTQMFRLCGRFRIKFCGRNKFRISISGTGNFRDLAPPSLRDAAPIRPPSSLSPTGSIIRVAVAVRPPHERFFLSSFSC